MDTAAHIEAILFYRGEPTSVSELAGFLSLDPSKIDDGLTILAERLSGRGIALVREGEMVTLATGAEASELIQKITKEELERDLTKAASETLAIVLYLGPVTRSRVDYIRGVNSAFIMRSLMVRGLIERVQNKKDARVFLYRPTLSLLTHLGVQNVSDLPDYDDTRKSIESFEKEEQNIHGEE